MLKISRLSWEYLLPGNKTYFHGQNYYCYQLNNRAIDIFDIRTGLLNQSMKTREINITFSIVLARPKVIYYSLINNGDIVIFGTL